MRIHVLTPLLAALTLAGCSSHCCGRGGVPPGPEPVGSRPGRVDRNRLPGQEYARLVAAHEAHGEALASDVAGAWARTRQDGGAYFAGGGSSAADTHMKVNQAP